MYYVFVDESGRDDPVGCANVRGKARLFVVFASVVKLEDVDKLENAYRALLDKEFRIVDRFKISELFDLYRRVTGREPEIKAGYLNNRDGPFLFFRDLPRCYDDKYDEFRRTVFEYMLRTLTSCSVYMVAIVVDKADLHKLSKKTGHVYDPRLIAMDYLFTRIASFLEKRSDRAVVIHDDTHRADEVKGLLDELKRRGYFYNPRLKHRPRYYLIDRIEFVDSAQCIPIQFVDLAANVVLNTRAGASKEFYNIVAGTSKYFEIHVPRTSKLE